MKLLLENFKKSFGDDQTALFGGEGMSEGGDVPEEKPIQKKNQNPVKKIRIIIKTC